MSVTPTLEGIDAGLYAPANFGDADDNRPTAIIFDITGNGNQAPYTTAVNGMLQKHIDEIKRKAAEQMSVPTGWKQRLRSFLSEKNTELLDFLALSIPSHPTLGKGEHIMCKFSTTHFNPNSASVRDLVMDSSGANTIGEIRDAIASLKTGDSIKDHIATVRYIFDQYREAGELAMNYEMDLKSRVDMLDKAQGKLASIVDLEPTDAYSPLLEATESYLGTLFKKNQIDHCYKGFIAAYRRFITLRDIVLMMRAVESNVNEPLCTICLHDQVTFALSPCGHTYCQSCIKKQTGTCFVCRGTVRDRVKLYFG